MKKLILLAILTLKLSVNAIESVNFTTDITIDEQSTYKLEGATVNVTVNIYSADFKKSSGNNFRKISEESKIGTTNFTEISTVKNSRVLPSANRDNFGITLPAAPHNPSFIDAPSIFDNYRESKNTKGINTLDDLYCYPYQRSKDAVNALDYLSSGAITYLRSLGVAVDLFCDSSTKDGSKLRIGKTNDRPKKVKESPLPYNAREAIYKLGDIGFKCKSYYKGMTRITNDSREFNLILSDWLEGDTRLELSPYHGVKMVRP